MVLAGIRVRDQDVIELARLLRDAGFDETAETLENGYDLETKVLALTIADRESIIRALDDRPMVSPNCVACCSGSTSGVSARGSSRRRAGASGRSG